MQTDAILPSSPRGEELRYVTEHFNDLQGLRIAPLWAGLLALSLTMISHDLVHWYFAVATMVFLLSGGWMYWSKTWYSSRYGVVVDPDFSEQRSEIISIMHPSVRPPRWTRSRPLTVNFLLLMAFIAPMFYPRLHNSTEVGLLAFVFFVLPRCFYSVPQNTIIQMRRLLAIFGMIAICVISVCGLLHPANKWLYLTWSWAILLLLDLYDHWLFTRLLKGSSMEASYE